MMQKKKRSLTSFMPLSTLSPTLGVVPGDEITIITISDLPWNAGLASSASAETAVALAIGNSYTLMLNNLASHVTHSSMN